MFVEMVPFSNPIKKKTPNSTNFDHLDHVYNIYYVFLTLNYKKAIAQNWICFPEHPHDRSIPNILSIAVVFNITYTMRYDYVIVTLKSKPHHTYNIQYISSFNKAILKAINHQPKWGRKTKNKMFNSNSNQEQNQQK